MSNPTNSSNPEDIRANVREAYTKAVNAKAAGGGCCGGPAYGPSCGPTVQIGEKSPVTSHAGYGADELASVPADAAANAFGCGNPVAMSELEPGQTVLDLGSGAGIDLILAAKRVGPKGRVIGVDMTDAMIEHARENIRKAGLSNVEVRKGVIENLPVEAGTVDWVISNCVINLSPEKDRVFAEIHRVLKPGGRMLVSDIVVESMPDWLRQSAAMYAACVSGAVSEKEYLDGLKRAGLADAEVRGRLVYDTSMIKGIAGSEIDNLAKEFSCGCGASNQLNTATVDALAGQFAGKVASVKFYARKP